MKKSPTTRVAAVGSLALGLCVALGLPAQAASTADHSANRGTCSGGSRVQLTAKGHRDSIFVRARIKSDTPRDDWAYVFTDNGTTVASGDKRADRRGTVRIRSHFHNQDGSDTIALNSVDSTTGEVCTAQVVFRRHQ